MKIHQQQKSMCQSYLLVKSYLYLVYLELSHLAAPRYFGKFDLQYNNSAVCLCYPFNIYDLYLILQTHLPGYVSDFEKFKAKGVDEIICVSVNDPFVMAAWGRDQNADGKVRMLADTNGAFTKAIDLEKDLSGPLGNVRCQRFSMVVEDGVVKTLNVEPDGTGLTCSLSNNILSQL